MKGLEPQDGTSAATRLVNGEPSPSIESRQQSSPRCACVVPPVSWTVDGGTQAARAACGSVAHGSGLAFGRCASGSGHGPLYRARKPCFGSLRWSTQSKLWSQISCSLRVADEASRHLVALRLDKEGHGGANCEDRERLPGASTAELDDRTGSVEVAVRKSREVVGEGKDEVPGALRPWRHQPVSHCHHPETRWRPNLLPT